MADPRFEIVADFRDAIEFATTINIDPKPNIRQGLELVLPSLRLVFMAFEDQRLIRIQNDSVTVVNLISDVSGGNTIRQATAFRDEDAEYGVGKPFAKGVSFADTLHDPQLLAKARLIAVSPHLAKVAIDELTALDEMGMRIKKEWQDADEAAKDLHEQAMASREEARRINSEYAVRRYGRPHPIGKLPLYY